MRRRILLTCYAIEAGKGSESGSGYNFARRVAGEGFDLTLITRRNNAERLRLDSAFEGVTIVGYDPSPFLTFWKRKSRGVIPYYYIWQVGVGRIARRLHEESRFDVLHNYNFHTDWAPHFLRAKDATVVWGPICHQPRVPTSFLRLELVRGSVREWSKAATKQLFWTADPALRRAIKSTSVIIYANEDVARPFASARGKIRFESFGGASFAPHSQAKPEGPLRLLHVGRTVSIKGGQVAVDGFAAAVSRGSKAQLTFVGDGPLRHRLERYVQARGLTNVVSCIPRVRHEEMESIYHAADALLYPSLGNQDTVVAEALAAGLPVICLAGSGTSGMAGPAGLAVPRGPYRRIVEQLASRILEVERAKAEGRLDGLRQAARARARLISWDGTVRRIVRAYGAR